jgi:hypothetical protein
MCRSIKTLRSTEPASIEEIEAAALQFVRKISGMRKPSERNEAAFNDAVHDITGVSQRMLDTLGLTRPSGRSVSGAAEGPSSSTSAHATKLRTRAIEPRMAKLR